MSGRNNEKLTLWRESIKEYCASKNTTYKVPKKGSKEYDEVKKIYNNKLH